MNNPDTTPQSGLLKVSSPHSVKTTTERLETIIQDKGMKLFASIDHSIGAQAIGESLRPTNLLIFGNPQAGTPLMQNQQSMGIDLPQKILISEDADGNVSVLYNDPNYLAERHGIEGCEELNLKISAALGAIVQSATSEH